MPTAWEEPAPLNPGLPQVSDNLSAAADLQLETRVDAALQFLGNHLALTGRSRNKSVLMHSMRVGNYLRDHNCHADVIVAGILHDVLEATEVSPRMIETMFGKAVRKIVKANTVDRRKSSWYRRFRDSLERCGKIGVDALVVRAADMLDNVHRHHNLGNGDKLARLCEKLPDIMKALEPYRGSEPAGAVYRDLETCSTVLTKARTQ